MQNCMGGKAVLLSPYRLSDGTTPLASIKASVLSRAEFLSRGPQRGLWRPRLGRKRYMVTSRCVCQHTLSHLLT